MAHPPQTKVLGLGPSPGAERIAHHLAPLTTLLRAQLRDPTFEVRVLESFSEVGAELDAGGLAFGWLPAAPFVRAARTGRPRPLLQSIRGDQSSYFSVLFVREDSPARVARELQGRRIAWVSRDSSAGYLLAAHALSRAGVRLGAETFEGSHAAVVRAVATGAAEAGATFCTLDLDARPNRIRSAGWTETIDVHGIGFRALVTFGPIPGDLLCSGPTTNYGDRALFAGAMARLHLDPAGIAIVRGLFGADRFELALAHQIQNLRLATEQFEGPERH